MVPDGVRITIVATCPETKGVMGAGTAAMLQMIDCKIHANAAKKMI